MPKVISEEHGKEILRELCARVGVDSEKFDFSQPNWYWKYTWTSKDEEDFRIWLGKKLEEWKYCKGKKRGMNMGYYEAGKLILNYGWKVQDL